MARASFVTETDAQRRERYLARHRRYNHSEKGRARWLRYYDKRMDDPDPSARAIFRGSEGLRKRRYAALKRIRERQERKEVLHG